MQLITLNTWGGRVHKPLMDLLDRYSSDTDIFCFQEVYSSAPESLRESSSQRMDLYSDLVSILPGHRGYFSAQVEGTGVATFIKSGLEVVEVIPSVILSAAELSHFKMPTGEDYFPRPLLRVDIKQPRIAICNVHGVPGSEKRDTPERELQTARIVQILNTDDVPKILAGDFNLSPDTVAIQTLESQMQNPLKRSIFKTTRSGLYNKNATLPFADYVFVSPELKVKQFEVLQDEVSDHLPLRLEFE